MLTFTVSMTGDTTEDIQAGLRAVVDLLEVAFHAGTLRSPSATITFSLTGEEPPPSVEEEEAARQHEMPEEQP